MTTKLGDRILRYAKHASATDVETEPGTLYPICWRTLTPRHRTNKAENTTRCGSGERNPRVVTDEEAGLDFGDALHGLSENDGTTVDEANHWNLTDLFEHIFGSTAIAGGAATAMTCNTGGGSAAAGTIGVDDDTKTAPGQVLAFTGTDGKFIARENVSEASGAPDVITTDRAFSALPSNGATILGGLTFYLDPVADVEHLYFEVEAGTAADGWREKFFGCQVVSLRISVPAKGEVAYQVSVNANHPNDDSDPAEPTLTLLSKGTGIRVADSPFFIGDDEYCFLGGDIIVELEVEPLVCTNGPNGSMGFVVKDRRARIEGGAFYLGDGTEEMPHAGGTVSVEKLNEEATFDVALQVGTGATKAAYFRFPALDFTAELGERNGIDVVTFTGYATKSGNHATVPGAFRMHIL